MNCYRNSIFILERKQIKYFITLIIWYDAFPVNKIRNSIVKQISNNLIKNEIDIIKTIGRKRSYIRQKRERYRER